MGKPFLAENVGHGARNFDGLLLSHFILEMVKAGYLDVNFQSGYKPTDSTIYYQNNKQTNKLATSGMTQ